jgi:hypothetical protein
MDDLLQALVVEVTFAYVCEAYARILVRTKNQSRCRLLGPQRRRRGNAAITGEPYEENPDVHSHLWTEHALHPRQEAIIGSDPS